jgi:hypothetical protein
MQRPMSHGVEAALSMSRKLLAFIVMMILTGVLYAAFRGYLSPAMLIDFANMNYC